MLPGIRPLRQARAPSKLGVLSISLSEFDAVDGSRRQHRNVPERRCSHSGLYPLLAKSRHPAARNRSPLYPQNRTPEVECLLFRRGHARPLAEPALLLDAVVGRVDGRHLLVRQVDELLG